MTSQGHQYGGQPPQQQQYHNGYGQQQPQYQQQPPPQQYGQQPQYQQPPAQQYGQQPQYAYSPPHGQAPPPPHYEQPQYAANQKPNGQVHQGSAVDGNSGKTSTDVVAGIPLYEEDLGPENNSKFVKRGYQDVWAIPLFIIVMLGTIIGGIYYDSVTERDESTTEVSDEAKKYLPWAAAATVVLALTSLMVMKCAPVGYIYFANILGIAMIFALGIFCLAYGAYIMGVIFILFGCLAAFVFYRLRHLIPFAALLLKTSVDLATRYWGSFIVGAVTLVLLFGFFAAWSLACIPVMGALEGSNGATIGSYFILFVLVFILFWAIQTGANVVHVTASGVVATWYFVGEQRMPKTAVPANLKRSLTTSFGSICFGSAVVALLKTIYYFLRSAVRSSRAHILVKLIAMCLIGIIERLTEMFNIYAFTQVAIYGHDFVTAAKQTFALVKESGWSLIINDCLVWRSLAITNLVCSLGLCVVFWIAFNPIVGLLTLAVALSVFTIFFRPVYAGIATQFVCIAENPTAMEVANPEWAATTNALKPQDVGNQETGGDQRPVQRVDVRKKDKEKDNRRSRIESTLVDDP
eukprot:CAMPEP_0174828880 /NCGR_PEP_ID=MMETSP1114-20130205/1583_1 /TAXON_ID=312471 /ORGANISM="Neobodo designis, Strain CCAP 1951/1" /LENGTH=577 /DNA_ID=CAMNT_0016062607 /DNA_START=76 /DNA_END=1810 /DNA_ORIENTATION=+